MARLGGTGWGSVAPTSRGCVVLCPGSQLTRPDRGALQVHSEHWRVGSQVAEVVFLMAVNGWNYFISSAFPRCGVTVNLVGRL